MNPLLSLICPFINFTTHRNELVSCCSHKTFGAMFHHSLIDQIWAYIFSISMVFCFFFFLGDKQKIGISFSSLVLNRCLSFSLYEQLVIKCICNKKQHVPNHHLKFIITFVYKSVAKKTQALRSPCIFRPSKSFMVFCLKQGCLNIPVQTGK